MQEDAFDDDHASVNGAPTASVTDCWPFTVSETVGLFVLLLFVFAVCGVHVWYWYEPERAPLTQFLFSETHCCPAGTVDAW